jgi:prepilin-type N-terminal cleavage/methylation domain-containing protein
MWARQKRQQYDKVARQHGFTLVELLIVIVVIAILAAITIVAYNGIQNRAQLAKAQSDANSTAKKIEIFNIDNGSYPGSITDCPAPAATNLCLAPISDNVYTYKSNPVVATGRSIVATAAYELTVANSKQFLYMSPTAKTSGNEFMQFTDLAPIIDKYGLVKYQLSFDIKSANTASQATMAVYFQNGSGARYNGLAQNVPVTTSYTSQTLTFTPFVYDATTVQSILAFYGTYGTGNIASVTNVRLQLAP